VGGAMLPKVSTSTSRVMAFLGTNSRARTNEGRGVVCVLTHSLLMRERHHRTDRCIFSMYVALTYIPGGGLLIFERMREYTSQITPTGTTQERTDACWQTKKELQNKTP